MILRGLRPLLIRGALVAAAGALLVAAAPASAQSLTFAPCRGNTAIGCSTLEVPLDHADPAKGTLSLAIQRRKAKDTRKGVIVMLAGGPGQSAGTLSPTQLFPAALPGWDYVVLDQRGTGKGALRCAALDTPTTATNPSATAVSRCADQIGPNRIFYGTRASVLDIDQLRVALDVTQIALGGVSYGTYVTQYYAQLFPANVSHLVLDSPVDPANMDGIGTDMWSAVRGQLAALCAGTLCKGITTDPVGDLATLVARSNPAGLRGTGSNVKGKPVTATIGGPKYPADLPNYLVAGDLSYGLRALWPGAVKAATRGDMGPMIRLGSLAEHGDEIPVTEISRALFMSTTCADDTAIWTSADPGEVRTAKLDAAYTALGDAAFAPFAIMNARANAAARDCTAWPETSTDALAPGSLPAVPTVIFSGGQDLRTPTANALAVAGRSPSATVVVAPGWGHDLTDNLDCAGQQVARLLAGSPVRANACADVTVKLTMAPIPAPAATVSALSPMGAKGTPGRVAHAARFSLQDALWSVNAGLDAGLQGIPGVRSGFMRVTGLLGETARFSRYSDTKGVSVTGALTLRNGALNGRVTVNGPGSMDGYLDLHNERSRAYYSGVIGGTRISIKLR